MKAVDTATSAGNKGQKHKNDLTQQDQDGSYENPPAKRGKALPAAEQWTCPVPHPMQKNTKHLEGPNKHHNTKKRPSEVADMAHENTPRTPVLSKNAKIGLNKKSKGTPICWTVKPVLFSAQIKLIKKKLETMIELVGSKVVAWKPTDINQRLHLKTMLMVKKQ